MKLQEGIDEYVESIETQRQERMSEPDVTSPPRRRIFGTAKPGKSTHPYNTGIDPTATSESVPLVEPARSDTTESSDAGLNVKRILPWRKSPKVKLTSEPAIRGNRGHSRSPSESAEVPKKRKQVPVFRREWRNPPSRTSQPHATPPGGQPQEKNQSGNTEPLNRLQMAWGGVKVRRARTHAGDLHSSSTTDQQTSGPSDSKNKQREAPPAPTPAAGTGQPVPESPIIRFISSIRKHSPSPLRETISPLDINSEVVPQGSARPVSNQPISETRGSDSPSTQQRGRNWLPFKRTPLEGTPVSVPKTAEGGDVENRCPTCGHSKPAPSPRPRNAPTSSAIQNDTGPSKRSRRWSRTQ